MIAVPDIPQQPPFRFVSAIEKCNADVCITHLEWEKCQYFIKNNIIHAEALIEFAAQSAICNAILQAPKQGKINPESSKPGMLAAVKHFETYNLPEKAEFLRCELHKHAEMVGFTIYNATIYLESSDTKFAQIQFAVFQP